MGGLVCGYAHKGGIADVVAAKPKMLISLGADEVDYSKFSDSIIVYIGHHGDKGAHAGDVILPADGTTINERRKLALNGQVSVAVAVGRDGRLIGTPQVRVQGVPVEEEREAFVADAAGAAAEAVRGKRRDADRLREDIRLAVRRAATRWTGKKPIVDVLLVQA